MFFLYLYFLFFLYFYCFQGCCFKEENYFWVHTETIQYLSLFDAKNCSSKGKEATRNTCNWQAFLDWKKSTLLSSCYPIHLPNNTLDEIAALLVPKQVIFYSQDDKAKLALGRPAENKQTPILILIEYEVRLPYHNFTVAPIPNFGVGTAIMLSCRHFL